MAAPYYALVPRSGHLTAHVPDLAGQVVEIRKRKTQRSNSQNNWLWGQAYPPIAEHCGYDDHEHERLHYDLLSVRFGTVAVAPLIAGAPPRIMPARTSSQLSTKEFSDYMEWLVRYAAMEFHVTLELPDERQPVASRQGDGDPGEAA